MKVIFPKLSQWKQIFRVLKRREKITLFIFFALAISSFIFLVTDFYFSHTKIVPAFGGTYTEGIVGQPRFINPIYGEANDIDRTLTSLVFSGLLTYDKDGNIVKDLADNYTVSEDGKTYTFTLKNNIFWHDGKPLTTDDILFTIEKIQNSDYKSPLRANWIDVQVQKISNTTISFILRQPYNSFLENCTLKIIPKHIWENISPENFTLSLYNLQPVGSGPFTFTSIKQTTSGFISSLQLQSNLNYYQTHPFISTLAFKFFEKKDDLMAAADARAIDGFAIANLDNTENDIEKTINGGWVPRSKFQTYSFSLPRYFAVFFNNQKTSIFSDSNLRKAFTFSINKKTLIETIQSEIKTKLTAIDSPILPDFYNYLPPTNVYGFDIAKAEKLLDASGFKKDASGQRSKAINKKPAFQFTSYLKVGSKGTDVTQLQMCLSKLPSKVEPLLNGNFVNLLKGETNGTYGKPTENAVTEFQKEYLPTLKPTGEIGTSTRQKLNELCFGPPQTSQKLQFTLVTINQPQLIRVANLLKDQWQTQGIQVQINAVGITDIKPIIKNRSYDALLYGESLGMEPDLYPFWYSSQKQDPGLNLSLYENKNADALLKDARQTLDSSQKKQDLEKLQNIITTDAPALFLYNPDYVYWISDQVKGIETTKIADPSRRFENIINWFINTKRAWK